jgi:ketosteroid isomerase-like protein
LESDKFCGGRRKRDFHFLAQQQNQGEESMSDANAIFDRRKQHIDGFNRQDQDAMASTASDDIVIMAPNTPTVIGLDAARAWWSSGFEAAEARFDFEPLELDIEGDLAIDRFHWIMTTTPRSDGETTRDDGDCIWIWRQGIDGSWRVTHAIWNSHHQSPGVWSGAPRS